jgi:NAD(P)-dependent dehydrogenase (short-subunit alcohol dehydrogenase family)
MNKSVFITGCSSGLGRETAIQFANSGYRVFAGVRDLEDAAGLKEKFAVIPVVVDLRNSSQILTAAADISNQCGNDGLSLLINMAGYTFISPIEYTEQNAVKDLFDVIVLGPSVLTTALLPALKQHFTTTHERAKVINIVSWAALDTSPFVGFYSAAKAALLKLTEAQSLEFARINVDAIAILPGMMDTPFVTLKAGREINESLAKMPETGKAAYGTALEKMYKMSEAGKSNPIVASPSMVARRILKIASRKKPQGRYDVGIDTFVVSTLSRILPGCLLRPMKRALYSI